MIMIGHVIGFMIHPRTEWEVVAKERELSLIGSVIYTAVLAVIPAVAWYMFGQIPNYAPGLLKQPVFTTPACLQTNA